MPKGYLLALDFSQVSDFLSSLTHAGLTIDQAYELTKNPELARVLVDALRSREAYEARALFTEPKIQLARARKSFNDLFTKEQFDEAERRIPKLDKNGLVAATLVPYLEDLNGVNGVQRTFDVLTRAIEWSCRENYLCDYPVWFSGYGPCRRVRLAKGLRHVPGLRWEVIDHGSPLSRKIVGDDCRLEDEGSLCVETHVHAGGLASAFFHPKWLSRVGGICPTALMDGYQLTDDDISCPGEVYTLSLDYDGGCRRLSIASRYSPRTANK